LALGAYTDIPDETQTVLYSLVVRSISFAADVNSWKLTLRFHPAIKLTVLPCLVEWESVFDTGVLCQWDWWWCGLTTW